MRRVMAGASVPVAPAPADPESAEASSASIPSRAAGLTAREHEVLQLLAQGMSDREIAEELSLSPRTVRGHVTHLLGKLGVDARTAAAYAPYVTARSTPR